MRQISPIYAGGLILATFLILAGAGMALFPTPTVVSHGTYEAAMPGADYEVMGEFGVRVYGFVAMAVGCGIAALMIYLMRNPTNGPNS